MGELYVSMQKKRKQRFRENLAGKTEELVVLVSSASLQGVLEGMVEEQAFKQEEADLKTKKQRNPQKQIKH